MNIRRALNTLSFVIGFLTLVPLTMASTTWYVNGSTGSNSNNCKSPSTACRTIGHAISLAASGDAVMVASGTYKENLWIGISLTITGAGAQTTVIDGKGTYSVVINFYPSNNVTLSALTIRNGFGSGNGGGIINNGTLTISNSTVSGNTTTDRCVGQRCFAQGGGIYNNKGALTINNSTLSANTVACGGPRCHAPSGGGIFNNQGKLNINNSTLSGNTAVLGGAGFGGGIYTDNNAAVTISNSTIGSNNGGGIESSAVVTLQNSIVANNAGGNCIGTMASNGYNVSSDATCNFSNSGDRNGLDPKLGPLQNNGGPTQTMALLPGSPAIDAGNPSGCTDGQGHLLKTDQRGQPRPDKEDSVGCDLGAYERQAD